MPLVLTTRRADWQPCRAGRERAVSSGGGVGREWPSQSDGFEPGAGSPCQRRPGWAASRLCAQRAASRLPAPGSQPLPWRAEGGAATAAELTAPGVRGKLARRQWRGPVWSGAPGHGGPERQRAAESQVSGPAEEWRSPRPERAGKHLRCREPDERLDSVPGSSCPQRTAPTVSRGLPQPFRSDCPLSLPLPLLLPRGLPPPCAPTRPPPPSLPLFLPPLGFSLLPSLPPLFPPRVPLPRPHFLSHTRKQTHSPSLRSPSVSLSPSFSFTFACPATF